MREENLQRLTHLTTSIIDPNYLVYKFLFEDIKDAVSQYSKGAVFDIGCGNKPYEQLFTNSTKYVGCDIVQSSNNRVDIICSVDSIPVADNEFDTVFSTQVIEHVEDHLLMLREAYRILRPGGKIIVTAPMAWEHHEVPYDYFRFTRFGLEHIFKKTGFKIIKIKANGGKWAFLGQMTQNVMMSSYRNKKGFFRRIFGYMHKFVFKYLINIFYIWLERIDKDEDLVTLNFIVIAEK